MKSKIGVGLAVVVLAMAMRTVWAGEPGTNVFGKDMPVHGGAIMADAQKFDFVVLGDRRGGEDKEWPVFDRAIEEINLLNPDFVVMVGDHIQGYTSDEAEFTAMWEDFWTHAGALKMPLVMVPGNHDTTNEQMLKHWKEKYGRTYYSFDYQNCHFLILNTQEMGPHGEDSLGDEQTEFALKDLAKNKKAEHTFVFMHQPLWLIGDNHPHWTKIEEALGDRPYTVLTGHLHNLISCVRNDKRYVVLSSTMGEKVDEPNVAPVTGAFPFYTQVTVNDGEANMACIEPGNIWSPDIATEANYKAVDELVRIETTEATGFTGKTVNAKTKVSLNNKLPQPVTVALSVTGLQPGGWQLDGEPNRNIDVAANSEQEIVLSFSAPVKAVLPLPRVRCTPMFGDKELHYKGAETSVSLFPSSALRNAPDWMGIGGWEAGKLPAKPVANPKEAMPGMFVEHGPEKGCNESAEYDLNGQKLTWQPYKTQVENGKTWVDVKPADAGALENIVAYGACAIKSPRKQTVYARFGIDDYARVFVNGEPIEGDRVFCTEGVPTFIALPLNEGWNDLLVKTGIKMGTWAFEIQFADPNNELEFAPVAPTQ